MSGKKQKKQVVLMIAKNFLAYHKRAGQATDFEAKIKAKEKLHTIRPNYEKWKEKIEEVKSGKAELVLKQWEGRPYRSTPNKLSIYDDKDDVDVSKLTKTADGFFVNDTIKVEPEILAKNDGLSLQDFEDWFKVFPTEPMALIHLTGFRYENNG